MKASKVRLLRTRLKKNSYTILTWKIFSSATKNALNGRKRTRLFVPFSNRSFTKQNSQKRKQQIWPPFWRKDNRRLIVSSNSLNFHVKSSFSLTIAKCLDKKVQELTKKPSIIFRRTLASKIKTQPIWTHTAVSPRRSIEKAMSSLNCPTPKVPNDTVSHYPLHLIFWLPLRIAYMPTLPPLKNGKNVWKAWTGTNSREVSTIIPFSNLAVRDENQDK